MIIIHVHVCIVPYSALCLLLTFNFNERQMLLLRPISLVFDHIEREIDVNKGAPNVEVSVQVPIRYKYMALIRQY